MTRATAPVLNEILTDLEGLCSIIKPASFRREQASIYRAARRELRHLLAVYRAARDAACCRSCAST